MMMSSLKIVSKTYVFSLHVEVAHQHPKGVVCTCVRMHVFVLNALQIEIEYDYFQFLFGVSDKLLQIRGV